MCSLKTKIKDYYYLKIKKMSIYEYNAFRMREKGIAVGEKCHICSYIQSSEPWLISIGDKTTISSNVTFCTHDNAICKFHDKYTDVVGSIKIGNNCFIGMNSIIMLGVEIGDNCIVGAGSVVTKSLKPGSVVAGNPARLISNVDDYLKKNERYGINFRGMSQEEKFQFFSNHPEKIILKE